MNRIPPSRSRRPAASAAAAVMQPLESRQMFSVATFEVADRILTVTGTDAADRVQFNANGSNLVVNLNGAATPVPFASFDQIEVYAGGGNDRIFRGFGVAVRMYALGGPGNDLIQGTDAKDTLTGGGGDDTIVGNDGDDRINGGPGNDALSGNNGRDRLFGGDGNDTLEGNAGADRLFGGNGDDRLAGGAGIDRIFGESGRDTILGGPGLDQVDGGAGVDTVRDPQSDVLVATERVI